MGRVLPIGGLREKTMAAYRSRDKKTVLIPKDNVPDLYEVDPVVKKHVQFVPVEQIEQVLQKALVKAPDHTYAEPHTGRKKEVAVSPLPTAESTGATGYPLPGMRQ